MVFFNQNTACLMTTTILSFRDGLPSLRVSLGALRKYAVGFIFVFTAIETSGSHVVAVVQVRGITKVTVSPIRGMNMGIMSLPQ